MTVSRSKWEELSEMKKVMKDMVECLAVCERALKTGATSEEGGTPATKKIHLPTIKDKYFEQPRLVNQRHFNDWWAKGLSKTILRPRAEQELGNMGLRHVFLSKLSSNVLAEDV